MLDLDNQIKNTALRAEELLSLNSSLHEKQNEISACLLMERKNVEELRVNIE